MYHLLCYVLCVLLRTGLQHKEKTIQSQAQSVKQLQQYIHNVLIAHALVLRSDVDNKWECVCVPRVKHTESAFYRNVMTAMRQCMIPQVCSLHVIIHINYHSRRLCLCVHACLRMST